MAHASSMSPMMAKRLVMTILFQIAAIFILVLPVFAEQFTITGSGVSFDAPAGFTRLSQDEIDLKYQAKLAPAFVVGNERRTTTIAYDLRPQELSPDHLNQDKQAFEKIFERSIPGLIWKDRKIITLQNQRWIYFEMTSQAIDSDIHNIMLITPHKGKMLLFNFNSTVDDYKKFENVFKKSIQSITLKDG